MIHAMLGVVIKEGKKRPQYSSAANVELAKVYPVLKRLGIPSPVISEVLKDIFQVTLGSLPDASAKMKINAKGMP